MNDWQKRKSTQKPSYKQSGKRSFKPGPRQGKQAPAEGENYWLYGMHTVRAALDNPARKHHRLLATVNGAKNLGDSPTQAEIVERRAIDRLVTADAVHQGVVLEVSPLDDTPLEDLLADPTITCLVILDQVTDPHNVGAIMRSATAFGASAVVTTWRHSPPETAVLAKASAGTLEIIPYIRGNNLADQMTKMQDAGFMLIGLDADGDTSPHTLMHNPKSKPDRFALVLGAEGKGLRQRTSTLCDVLMSLPISNKVDSLNVSNAAAVALYALTRD